MGALIPGCQVAHFAFTVSPFGSKIDEKIFEKGLSHANEDG
jgi:hypothetical protein